MSIGMILAGSVERTSACAGDKSAPQIPYLDYYDAACSAREESGNPYASNTITTTGEPFAAPQRSVEIRAGRRGWMADHAGTGQQMAQNAETEAVQPLHSMTYQEMLANKINEILEKIESGATEPVFPIGASFFTLKEWEIFIRTFDKIQEEMKEEAGQELPPKDTTVAGREGISDHEEAEINEKSNLWLLLLEQTSCSYPPVREEEDEVRYDTYYAQDEIYCRRTDASGYEWVIPLEDTSQYEQIMEFLGHFEKGANLRFTCHENFWRDFLDGTLDLDGFVEFMDTRVQDGIPNYVNVNEYGMWIDTEAVKYAKYMNQPGLFRMLSPKDLLPSMKNAI